MDRSSGMSFKSVFEEFVISKTAQGVSESTLNNYEYALRSIGKYLNIEESFESITKRDIEKMVVHMRKKGCAHNTIATYLRLLKTFYNWCDEEDLHYQIQRVSVITQLS